MMILINLIGNADGLGDIRKKELKKSAIQLGLRNESDTYVVDDPIHFPDSMTKIWSKSDISNLLATAFAPDLVPSNNDNHATSNKKRTTTSNTNRNKDKPPKVTIDILLTFDQKGISNHPNHRSLYHGAIHFLNTLIKDKPSGYSNPVTLYTLTTTNILRKYLGVLDVPTTMISGILAKLNVYTSKSNSRDYPRRLLFVNSIQEWLTAQSAMVKAHQSQMVWFRWGWITIGRYMVVNDLRREV